VGLGSNLGDPVQQMKKALAALEHLPGTRVVACSSLYSSAPIGELQQPDFVNAVAALETALTARDLLDALLDIERAHGRTRAAPNAPRTLDLDLLLFGDAIIDAPGLVVPHPRLHERAFVLVPLLELSPDVVVPGRGRAADLLPAVAAQRVTRIAGKH
jgi:2-amino-4-hydroxy-6-hydroxymethyldihydropteridine diphosphokinase